MNNELKHHGILGMKWGIRRYQNEDGTLTPAGRERYQKEYRDIGRKAVKYAYKQALSKTNARKAYVVKEFQKSYKEDFPETYRRNKAEITKAADDYFKTLEILDYMTDPSKNKYFKKANDLVEKYKDLDVNDNAELFLPYDAALQAREIYRQRLDEYEELGRRNG